MANSFDEFDSGQLAPLPATATDITSGGNRVGSPTGKDTIIQLPSPPKGDSEDAIDANEPTTPDAPANGTPLDIQPPTNETSQDLTDDGTQDNGTSAGAFQPPVKAAVPKIPNTFDEFDTQPAAGIAQRNTNAFNDGVVLNGPPGQSSPEQDSVKQYAQQDEDKVMQLASTRFTAAQLADMKTKPIGFWEAFQRLDTNQVAPLGGIDRLYEANDLVRIANKIKTDGEESLSPGDADKINEFLDNQVEQRVRGFTWGGNIAYIGSQIPAFVAEFAATGGVGKLAQQAIVKGGEELAVNAAVRIATGAAARVATQTALMPGQYLPKYGEQRLNDISAVTDKGDLILKESQDSPAKSALKAFGYTAADVAGQNLAPVIGKYIAEPLAKAAGDVIKTPLVAAVNQLPAAVRDGVYQGVKALTPNAQMSKVFSAVGWAGAFEQIGANHAANILHSSLDLATDKNYTVDDYLDHLVPTKQEFYVEAGLVGIGGGISAASHITANIFESRGLDKMQAQETVDNMSANEKEHFINQNLPLPTSKYISSRVDPSFAGVIPPNADITSTAPGSEANNTIREIDQQFGKKTVQAPTELKVGLPKKVENNTDTIAAAEALKSGELTPEQHHAIAQGVGDSHSNSFAYAQDDAEKNDPPPVLDKESGFNEDYKNTIPKIDDKESPLDLLKRKLRNDVEPITRLTDVAAKRGVELKDPEDPILLMSDYRRTSTKRDFYLQVSPFKYDEKGNVQYYGKSLKAIRDDFDNVFMKKEPSREQRSQDFSDYLRATRYTEDLAQRFGERIPEKLAWSKNRLEGLQEKYGEDYPLMKSLGKEVVEFNQGLKNLLVPDIMTQEQSDQLDKDNPNYIPLNKILNEAQKSYTGGKRGYDNARMSNLIKKMKGSELEDKNPWQNMVVNTHKAIELQGRNAVAKSIVNISKVAPELVRIVPPNMIKKGTLEARSTYDPKLRAKLEAAITELGGTLKREKSVKVKGYSNVLGSYSPSENIIRAKLGSKEGELAHEVGHMLDYRLGLKEKMLSDPVVKKQLQTLAEDRLTKDIKIERDDKTGETRFVETLDKKPSDKYLKYIKNDREILANLFETYVNAPERLEEVAPAAKKAFEKIIDADPKLAYLKDIKPSSLSKEELIPHDLFGEDPRAPEKTITAFVNGEKVYARVAEPILRAVKGLQPTEVHWVERVLTNMVRAPRDLLRFGATHTPDFPIRHTIKYAMNAAAISGVPLRNLDFKSGILQTVRGGGDLYNEYMATGLKSGTYSKLGDPSWHKLEKELFNPDGKIARYLKNPFKIMEDATQAGVNMTKIAVFQGAKKQGLSDLRAANMAADLENFGRGGDLTKWFDRNVVPFSNIAVQSADKVIRMLADPKTRSAVLVRGIGLLSTATIARVGYILYGAPNDVRQAYLETPDWMKSINAVLPFHDQNGKVQLGMVPNAFGEVGYIFQAAVERMMLWAYNGNKPAGQALYKDLMEGLFGELVPIHNVGGLMPVPLKAYLEAHNNRNFFTDQSLFPKDFEDPKYDKTPEKRSKIYDSETAMMLGKALTLSPAKIDNTVQDFAGGAGKGLMQASDAVIDQIREWNGGKNNEKPVRNSDIPLLRGFLGNPPAGYASNSVQDFYKNRDETRSVKQGYLGADPADRGDYRKENSGALSVAGTMEGAGSQIAKLNKQSKAVFVNPNISGDEKQKRIDNINEKITTIARNANLHYDKATKGK